MPAEMFLGIYWLILPISNLYKSFTERASSETVRRCSATSNRLLADAAKTCTLAIQFISMRGHFVNNKFVSKSRTYQAIGVVAFLTAATSCQRNLSDHDSGPAGETLSLLENGSGTSMLSAKFHFPTDHQQMLLAPKGHTLEGTLFVAEGDSFQRDMVISMKEGVPMATTKAARDLALTGALTGAGPAILITSQDNIADANHAVTLTLPVKVAQADPNQNLTVLYRVIQQGRGGRIVSGLMRMDQLERNEHSVKLSSNYLGIFQAVYYSGDPAAIKEIRSSEGFYAVDDEGAKLPSAFTLRTPSGQVTGTYPQASWSASAGAVSYEVTVAKNKDCTDIVKTYDAISSASKMLEGLGDGAYFLCVSAVSAGGTRTPASNNGLAFDLTSSQLGLFHYEGTRTFATQTPEIRWSASQNAKKYRVAIASAPGCAQPLEAPVFTELLTWTPSQRRSDGTYYVCVTSMDAAGHSQLIDVDTGRPSGEGLAITIDTTKPGTFDVLGIGGPRGLISWTASSEAVWYNLVVATDSSCSQVVQTYNRIVATQTNVTIAGLQENTNYNICLSSLDNAGNIRVANNNGARFVFDTIAPRVLSVESVNQPGSYGLGSTIQIAVNFSEQVQFTGNSADVRLQLNTGNVATFASGSGSARWLFTYKVAAGDNVRLDYGTTNSFTIGNTGARDGAGNPAYLALPAPGSENSLAAKGQIVLDTLAPTVVSSTPANGAKDVAVRPDLVFTFSENIQVASVSAAVTVTKVSDSSNATANFDVGYDVISRTLKLTTKSAAPALSSASAYKVQVRGALDDAGNEVTGFVIQFTTK